MTEAVLSMCPNMIPNDIPPPSIDNNNTHSRKPKSSFVDEPVATQSSDMVTEKQSEDQKVPHKDECTIVMAEENSRETSEEQRPPNNEGNTITKESQKETKAGNNGSSKKKKKPKTKKRKNSTVF